MIIRDPIAVHARFSPEAPAIELGGRIVTYHQLDDTISGLQQQFAHGGAESGNIIGFVADDLLKSILLLWACFRCRSLAMPMSPRLPDDAIAAIMAEGACTFFVGGQSPDPRTPTIERDRNLDVEKASSLGYLQTGDLATVIRTSGSTGRPKLAIHRLRNHLYSAWDSFREVPLVKGDRWLLSIPLYHVGGIAILFRCFLAGATVVIPEKKQSLYSSVAELGISHVSVVSTQLRRWVAELEGGGEERAGGRFDSLRSVLCGGSAFSGTLIDRAVAVGLPIQLTYGLTEASSQVATTPVITNTNDFQFRARPLDHMGVWILDSEILIRGPNVFYGYVLNGSIESIPDEEWWFATGDYGSFEDGLLSVSGRKDNMFVSGGENIQPEEIEAEAVDTGLVDRMVVIAIPDEEYGYRPAAFVETSTDISGQRISDALREKLPGFKIPTRYYKLPPDLSSATKIRRSDLLKRLMAGECEIFE